MIKNKAQTPQAILPGILGLILILGLLSIFSQYKINLNKNHIDKNPTNLQAKKININIEQTKGSLPPLGIATAPIKLIEFSDFQCPFCRILHFETLSKIKEEYIDKGLAVLYYRDYSFLGPESVLASLASRCANEQNKFWEYHDIIFKNQKGENLDVVNYIAGIGGRPVTEIDFEKMFKLTLKLGRKAREMGTLYWGVRGVKYE